MAFNRPTLTQLIDRIEGDLKGGLSLKNVLRRSFIKVLARALAGAFHLVWGFLFWLSEQFIYDTATIEYLKRWAAIWGFQIKPATYAEFNVIITGTNGVSIPQNTIYKRTEDSAEYYVDAEVTIVGGTATAKLISSVAGAEYNNDIATIVSLESPISGVDSDATVDSIVVEGEDEEDVEDFRERFLTFIRERPSGGAVHDYIAWAKEVPGITRAWVAPQDLGPGTVTVAVVDDDSDPISVSPAKIQEVEDYIEDPTRKPVTAALTVITPTLSPLDLTIAIKPNNASVQAAVEAELKDLIFRDGAVKGTWKSSTEVYDGKILLSRINEAISIADGEEDHNLVSPVADVEPNNLELVTLGNITWQTLP